MNGKKVLFYDIMLGDRFLCTMRHKYLECFGVDLEKVIGEIFERRPSLRGKCFTIATDEFKCEVMPDQGVLEIECDQKHLELV